MSAGAAFALALACFSSVSALAGLLRGPPPLQLEGFSVLRAASKMGFATAGKRPMACVATSWLKLRSTKIRRPRRFGSEETACRSSGLHQEHLSFPGLGWAGVPSFPKTQAWPSAVPRQSFTMAAEVFYCRPTKNEPKAKNTFSSWLGLLNDYATLYACILGGIFGVKGVNAHRHFPEVLLKAKIPKCAFLNPCGCGKNCSVQMKRAAIDNPW